MQHKCTPHTNSQTCPFCGKVFRVRPSEKGRVHCSRACSKWEIPDTGMKKCRKCLVFLPFGAFGKHNKTRRSHCKECARKDNRARYYADHESTKAYHRAQHAINRERQNAAARRWKERNREYVDWYQREYNRTHRDVKNERSRRRRAAMPAARRREMYRRWNRAKMVRGTHEHWRLRNRDRIAENGRRWRERFPERHTERQRRRDAIKRMGQRLRPADYSAILKRDGMACYLCDRNLERHEVQFDHVIPLSKGGIHHETNIRVSCRDCNLRKSARLWPDMEEIYPEMAKRVRSHIERFLIQ